jgi:hypothetical protein
MTEDGSIFAIASSWRRWPLSPARVSRNPGLRPQELKDVFNLPESLARNRKIVHRQDLISSPKAFLLRVAAGMNANNVTAVANHLHTEAVPVHVVAKRQNECCVRVIEAVEERSKFRYGAIHRVGFINVLLGLTNFRVPTDACSLGS